MARPTLMAAQVVLVVPALVRQAWDPSLTGIRGLAISLVVAMHVGLPLPYGGPVGVTAFFVLSGFLITTLLLGEWRSTGRVDLKAFLIRRTRRLVPVLMACALVVAVAASATGSTAIWHDTILALSYVSNWARAIGDPMGLWNHAWSLAIEGQFYLVWPPIFMLANRRWRPSDRRWAIALVVAAASSAAWRAGLDLVGVSGDRLYFGTDTRAEALLAGCAIAYLLRGRPPATGLPRVAGPIATTALVGLATLGPIDGPLENLVYSLATFATCVVIASVRIPGRTWGLASRPMVWLGERSYSLYLWHVPVQLVVLALAGTGPTPSTIGASLTASMVLATISYAWIERPFRGRPRALPPTIEPASALDPATALQPRTMVPAPPS